MKRHIFAVVVAVLFVVLPAKDIIRASTSSYTIEDLGTTRDGFVPVVTGVNASGQVSGYVNVGSPRAVRFTDDIGWEYLPVPGSESYAMAINASGDVAGYHVVAGTPRAFRYTHATGVVETLALVTGGNMAWGFAINARGDVTGYGDASGAIRGWVAKTGGATVVVPTPGGDAVACGINDAGQIVGFYMTADGYQHAYRTEVDDSVTDIEPFDGPSGTGAACAIDGAGHVGGSATSGSTHADRAFRFISGAPVNLDTFASKSSTVAAIANGVSVGWFTTMDNVEHAFVHSDANGAANLNHLLPAGSGWYLHQAVAVNTAGQIVGHGKRNNVSRAFRVTVAKDTTPPVISALSATPSTVWPPKGQLVDVTVAVTATDDSDAAPVCAVSSISATAGTTDDFSFTGLAARVRAVGGRTYTLNVTCSDAAGNVSASSTDVVVPADTTAPVISAVSATPSTVWPPTGQLVNVAVRVTATDNVDAAPVCALSSITASGTTADDYSITGPLAARVRAVGGRTYTLNVTCADAAGNVSPASSTAVVVPPDTTAPTISSVHATPGAIWPPNGKMVGVTVMVSASDNVDSAPQCSLASITSNGGSAADAVVTGQFNADVRAERNADGTERVYSLHVKCADRAGNKSQGVATVVVGKDSDAARAYLGVQPGKPKNLR